MGVGGAMSRTAVNSGCKVRSPLSGLVTSAVVLVCIYELTGALYWIPKATLAAIGNFDSLVCQECSIAKLTFV